MVAADDGCSRRDRRDVATVGDAERWRALVQELIEREHAIHGATPRYPTRHLAEISLAVFEGLSIHRLLDPLSVTEETLGTTLSVLYDLMGVDDANEPAEAPDGPTPR